MWYSYIHIYVIYIGFIDLTGLMRLNGDYELIHCFSGNHVPTSISWHGVGTIFMADWCCITLGANTIHVCRVKIDPIRCAVCMLHWWRLWTHMRRKPDWQKSKRHSMIWQLPSSLKAFKTMMLAGSFGSRILWLPTSCRDYAEIIRAHLRICKWYGWWSHPNSHQAT